MILKFEYLTVLKYSTLSTLKPTMYCYSQVLGYMYKLLSYHI